jgi:Zn-dependent M28 family amino/carboxypeptidase
MLARSLPLLLLLCTLVTNAQVQSISGNRIRAHVRFLAQDLLEGRGVGSRGETLATEYLAAAFAAAGLKPGGDNGTWFQDTPLLGVQTKPEASLSVGGIALGWKSQFAGYSTRQTEQNEIDAEIIFVGHGIVAPEWKWNDYEGIDVKGKVVMLFTNEPISEDPAFFDGKALTYYGRWTYKFEEAARQGAIGCIILHTTPTAGYGWDVVKNSWGREDFQVKLQPGEAGLAMAAWIDGASGEKLAKQWNRSLEEMLRAADSRGFRAQPTGLRAKASLPAQIRPIRTRNVVGMVEGSDPVRKQQAVIFSAHWDHLGVGDATNGDNIYNGATDNGTGLGVLIEMGRAWAGLAQKPPRSAYFVAVTAEESGLRGSDYFARSGLLKKEQMAANLNFDTYLPYGRTKGVRAIGAERTSLLPLMQQTAARFNMELMADPRPEQGSYFRSDHFSFAKAGVPAFSINQAGDFRALPPGNGEKIFADYNRQTYHQPSDEYRDDWDCSGMEEIARLGMTLGLSIASLDKAPTFVTK